MALRHRQKKSIRRKRRFLKRKSAKTHRRTLTKRRIMRGGAKWAVNVYYHNADIATQISTPGIFTVDGIYLEETETVVFGTLTFSNFKNKFVTGKFRFDGVNKYKAGFVFILVDTIRLMIDYFEKVSEINDELSIGAAQFPTPPPTPPTPPTRWWQPKPSSGLNTGRISLSLY